MTKEQPKNCEYLPAHIANYFLWLARQENIDDVTPMKLIKLVYFGYAWCYAVFDRKLFTEKVEAWRHGPVVPSIYHEFKRFGKLPIDSYAIDVSLETGKTSYHMIERDDDYAVKILSAVWDFYKDKSGEELSRITHENGSPWCDAYEQGKNTPMDDSKIKERALEGIVKYQESRYVV
jgi:uncharacterized phage-associated protein